MSGHLSEISIGFFDSSSGMVVRVGVAFELGGLAWWHIVIIIIIVIWMIESTRFRRPFDSHSLVHPVPLPVAFNLKANAHMGWGFDVALRNELV